MVKISESNIASFLSSVMEYLHHFLLLFLQGITVMDDPIYSSLGDIGNFSASSLCLSTIMCFYYIVVSWQLCGFAGILSFPVLLC